ncbi:hypothetical protein AUQ44_16450 [Vibrio cidicii]|uniref:Uncharacterized protein n=1 Tax=Vibrio cidicii TaxID=1763883 RepID=A0A151JCU0_9VIBR|nr:hypothetical protein AUQ44_16450 [Vibrio cidicii]
MDVVILLCRKLKNTFVAAVSLPRLAVLGFAGFLSDLKSDHLIIKNAHEIHTTTFKFSYL